MTIAPRKKLIAAAISTAAVASSVSACGVSPRPNVARAPQYIVTSDGTFLNPLYLDPNQADLFRRADFPWNAKPCGNAYTKEVHHEVLVNHYALVKALRFVGFYGENLVKMAAIIMAESNGDIACSGDDTKPYMLAKNGKTRWTESVGGPQIRTILAQLHTNGPRDRAALLQGDTIAALMKQLYSAFEISNGGNNFRPWTTFKLNKHLAYMNEFRYLNAILDHELANPVRVPETPSTTTAPPTSSPVLMLGMDLDPITSQPSMAIAR